MIGISARGASERSNESANPVLHALVTEAWAMWQRAAATGVRAAGSMPILYFGDLPAYLDSPLRIVTVGLNPSHHEFPQGARSRGFPRAVDVDASDVNHYLLALNEYFRGTPYRWFRDLDKVLRGTGSSYMPGSVSTALHTDICSPVATNPTWSFLDKAVKDLLLGEGATLWTKLISYLQPHIIVMSVARKHLSLVQFAPRNDWQLLHSVIRKKDGTRRVRDYEVIARWHTIAGQPTLLVFGEAANTPFGNIVDDEKYNIGAFMHAHYSAAIL